MSTPDFALLLCAGLGTRLRPLTDLVPKPLLHFFDRPVAAWAADAVFRVGTTRLAVNAHAHAAQVQQWAAGLRPPEGVAGQFDVVSNLETSLLGTAGGARELWCRLDRPSGTGIIINGDIVADFPLDAMLRTHRRTGAVATMMTIPLVPGESAVHVDPSYSFMTTLPLQGDTARCPVRVQGDAVGFGGVYIVDAKVLAGLQNAPGCLIRQGLAPLLAAGTSIAAYHYEGFWADLGTPVRFLHAANAVLHNPAIFPALTSTMDADGVFIDAGATVSADASLEGPVWLGRGVVVEAGARVGPNVVIGPGCTVRAGASVRESVLMLGAEVNRQSWQQLVCGRASARAV